MGHPRGHNNRLYVLKPFTRDREHAKKRFEGQRIFEVPRPNPARVTNNLRNGKRITAETIAKATENFKEQLIPFWKA